MAYGNVAAERAALEMTYEGLCTITEFTAVKDPVTKATRQQEIVVLQDQPCALSQASLSGGRQTDVETRIDYDAKLFTSPDITFNAGSQIRVEQDGMDYKFEQSGEPFRYPTHQEIKLRRVTRA